MSYKNNPYLAALKVGETREIEGLGTLFLKHSGDRISFGFKDRQLTDVETLFDNGVGSAVRFRLNGKYFVFECLYNLGKNIKPVGYLYPGN